MIPILAIVILFLYEPNTTTPSISAGSSAILEVKEKKIPDEVIEIKRFFKSYNSVLQDYAQDFYDVSKEQGLDYRLLPAIAMVESTGARNTPHCAPYNPFGWSSTTSPCGFYRFSDYGEAINKVGEGIGRARAYASYRANGDLSELAKIYNPGGKEKWEKDIKFFMGKL